MKRAVLNLIKMLVLPVAVYIFFFTLCAVVGAEGFGVGTDLVVMLRTSVYTGLIALAVSYNLTSGRFDFSVGAVLVLSTILGVRVTEALGFGPLPMLLVSVAGGVVLGALSGALYVLLRLPPMVVSIGVAMLYEAAGFIFSAGKGAKLIGRSDLLVWAREPEIYILCLVVVAILAVLYNRTQFGYNLRSLMAGQETAVNVGVNEKRNAVACYAIAGGLLAIAGMIKLSIMGTVAPELGLSSISYIQNAFLPMFIGGVLARYGDRNTGVIIGAVTQSIITSAFGRLGVSSSWQMVLNGFIILAFFAYSFNSGRIIEFKMFKEKRLKAQRALTEEKRAEGTAPRPFRSADKE